MPRIVTILICLYFLINCVVWIVIEVAGDETGIYTDYIAAGYDPKYYNLYRFVMDVVYILIGFPIIIVAIVKSIRKKFRH